MLPRANLAIIERPEFRTLGTRIPLTELVTELKDALLRARLFLVTPRATEHCIETVVLNGLHESYRLDPIAAGIQPFRITNEPLPDRLFHGSDDQALTNIADELVAKLVSA